jgi:hypothetical protein
MNMINRVRFAIVKDGAKNIKTIREYLPINYQAEFARGNRDDVVIFGEDNHGWTLDGYVIPRLGSGLIVAKEI